MRGNECQPAWRAHPDAAVLLHCDREGSVTRSRDYESCSNGQPVPASEPWRSSDHFMNYAHICIGRSFSSRRSRDALAYSTSPSPRLLAPRYPKAAAWRLGEEGGGSRGTITTASPERAP